MAASKKKKACRNRWVDKNTILEVRNTGSAYWGNLTDAKTQKGTMNKSFQAEVRCHGLKLDVRRQSGYPPEIHLLPIKGRRVRYPF